MSENCIEISKLNDFIFCPVSIYFHLIDNETDEILLQETPQINGTFSHSKIDNHEYSDRKDILQATTVYSEKYNLIGKIDTFDVRRGVLTERKKKIKEIYDGYVFQLYAQYFSLKEMGYSVNEIRFYSLDDNKVYQVDLPEQNIEMLNKFEDTIKSIEEFDFKNFKQANIKKCERCIYRHICSFTDLEE